ncbi:MAG: TIGR02996 domain-containing protein [Myxococcota bacterium]
MATEAELLADVIAAPFDDGPRLAFADFLDAQAGGADPRAEFIRLQLRLVQPMDVAPAGASKDPNAEIGRRMAYMQDQQREQQLLAQHEAAWSANLRRAASELRFDRGFAVSAVVDASSFVKYGQWLLQQAPIVHVELRGVLPVLDALAACPALGQVKALSLQGQGIDDDALVRLLASAHLGPQWWLELGGNAIGMKGAEALAAAGLPALRYAGLQGNPVDPHETAGVDGQSIQDVALPPEGEALEGKYGFLPWLHYPTASMLDFPPNPQRAPLP